MTTWQPPIPSGALYSKPARQLGAGVALLAYCYDLVQTDGWLELNLHRAATDLDTAYPTIKYWWGLIKTSGIMAEIVDKGRKGTHARFDDYWLDWRILSARKPTEEMGSKREKNETTHYPETTENEIVGYPENEQEPETGEKREVNGRKTRQPIIPNVSRNKVLHDDHESERVSENNTPLSRALYEHPAVKAYSDITGLTPPRTNAELIAEQVTDTPKWEKDVKEWLANGFKPENILGMLDWYHGRRRHHQNGHKPPPERPPPPLNPVKPVENPLPREQLAEMARNSRKHHDTS